MMKSGVGVHIMGTIWDSLKQEEEMGFIFIDACNAFSEANHINIFWTV